MDRATEEKNRQYEGMMKKVPDFVNDDGPIRQPVAKLAKLLTNDVKNIWDCHRSPRRTMNTGAWLR